MIKNQDISKGVKIFHGGKRYGAGRKKGSRNKRTLETLIAVEQGGITPLEYMLEVMRDEALDSQARLSAACKAAPYIHPKLSSTTIQTSLSLKTAEEMTDEELDALILRYEEETD